MRKKVPHFLPPLTTESPTTHYCPTLSQQTSLSSVEPIPLSSTRSMRMCGVRAPSPRHARHRCSRSRSRALPSSRHPALLRDCGRQSLGTRPRWHASALIDARCSPPRALLARCRDLRRQRSRPRLRPSRRSSPSPKTFCRANQRRRLLWLVLSTPSHGTLRSGPASALSGWPKPSTTVCVSASGS